MDLSNRQWRALAQAYPYYFPTTSDESGAQTDADSATKRLEFEQYVVPRVSKTFADEMRRWEAASTSSADTHSSVDAVEAVLQHLFGCSALFHSASRSSPTRPSFHCAVAPLCQRELQLLGLYHRKQAQYEYVHSTRQQLLDTARSVVGALQSTLHAVGSEGGHEGLLDSTRESLVWMGRSQDRAATTAALFLPSASTAAVSPNNDNKNRSTSTHSFPENTTTHTTPNGRAQAPPAPSAHAAFTSALAAVPYSAAAAPLTVVNRCAGCSEVDGDLFLCTQCGEVRHEACGGPHPPERSGVDGDLPSINLCRRCAKDLNLDSSSSSLHSSTSSSERAELDKYFDSDDGSDSSSLSGFVVHSSEDEEEEGEDEGGEEEHSNSSSNNSSGSDSDGEKKKNDFDRDNGKVMRNRQRDENRKPAGFDVRPRKASRRRDAPSSSSSSSSNDSEDDDETRHSRKQQPQQQRRDENAKKQPRKKMRKVLLTSEGDETDSD